MAEGRHHEVAAVAADGADDVPRLAGDGVGAFHQRQIAARGSTPQRVEVGAGMSGDAHRPSSGPFAKVRARQPFVSVHALVEPSASATPVATPPTAVRPVLETDVTQKKPPP